MLACAPETQAEHEERRRHRRCGACGRAGGGEPARGRLSTARVTLIGDETELPYHKPPLSKTFMKDADAKPQILRAEAFYTGASIDLMLGASVERIDPAGRRLELLRRRQLAFDRAILATGSRPRMLPCRGRTSGRRAVAALGRRRPRHPRASAGRSRMSSSSAAASSGWRSPRRWPPAAAASPSSRRRTGCLPAPSRRRSPPMSRERLAASGVRS